MSLRRRMEVIWGLLFLNVLTYSGSTALLPIPSTAGKVVTQAALVAALLLAVSLNRRILVRPNLFLVLVTILSFMSLLVSARGLLGLASPLYALRLVAFVGGLWLLTPWWGRNDLLVLRCHRRALGAILAVVALGAVIAPGHAFSGGRLGGAIWPMPPTQVAHYAAILAGTTIVLWFTGLVRRRTAVIVTSLATVALLLTHTRTALVALLLAVLVASSSLFLTRRRVRKAVAVTIVVGALVALTFAPFLTTWFVRGESHGVFTDLSGRVPVWTALTQQHRDDLTALFGFGMSNDSFNGLPIDSSWLSVYYQQGLVGDAIVGAMLLLLLLVAAFSPRGPRRALALFLVVYVLVASITETGLGQANPYMLDLTVAASLLVAPATGPDGPTAYDVDAPVTAVVHSETPTGAVWR